MTAPTALIEPSFAELIAAIEQAAELPEPLGLLGGANRQMAGPPCRGDSGSLELGTDLGGPTAPRPGRRHGQDLGESPSQYESGTALVR
jgi:hypothetical protein